MPETGVKPVAGFRHKVRFTIADKAGQDAQNICLRYSFDHICVVTPDVIYAFAQRKNAVKDILLSPLIESNIIGLEPPLKSLYDHKIAVLCQHGLHAETLCFINEPPVPGQDFLKSCHK